MALDQTEPSLRELAVRFASGKCGAVQSSSRQCFLSAPEVVAAVVGRLNIAFSFQVNRSRWMADPGEMSFSVNSIKLSVSLNVSCYY